MTNNTIKFLVNREDEGKRLDICLSDRIPGFTRSYFKKIIETRKVTINDKISTLPSKKVKFRQSIIVNVHNDPPKKIKPSKIKLNVVYEDKDLLIVNKPSGMVVHPGSGNYENTLVNALIFKYKDHLSNMGGDLRPGIVHRIDKDTSGLIVIAKNNSTHSKLSNQFSEHSIKRRYVGLVWGVIRPLSGKIETLISRDKKNRQLMSVSEVKGKNAVTFYKTLKVFTSKNLPKISLIEFQLKTGRTHQIRVHMKFKGTCLVGDKQYKKKNIKFKKINDEIKNKIQCLEGQMLHAKSLGFFHPKKEKMVNFESNIPQTFNKLLNLLKKLSD